MYLYLGGEHAVTLNKLIGIFDLDTVTVSKHSRDFLARAQQNNQVQDACGAFGLPKSFVLTQSEVCLSPHNSVTLLKRAENAAVKLER